MKASKGIYVISSGVLLVAAAVSVWLCFFEQDTSPARLSGTYYLRNVREMGSQLELREDGRFRFSVVYGAYNGRATGSWRWDGHSVILNTDPPLPDPDFVLKSSKQAAPRGNLSVRVVTKKGTAVRGVEVYVRRDRKERYVGHTQYYGIKVPMQDGRLPDAIGLGMKMYGVAPVWIETTAGKGRYVFELEPGNLGRVKFDDQVFDVEGHSLTTLRHGRRIRYEKYLPKKQ